MPSFDGKKGLRFVITLSTGAFGSSKRNVVTIEGLRTIVDIDHAGGMMMPTLQAKIYGVPEADMHAATTIALQAAKYAEMIYLPNTIDVFAIDGTTATRIFHGNMINAWADYQGMPDVFLHIQAQGAVPAQFTPVKPRSFKGAIDVATVMKQIADDMGFKFEPNGVSVTLTDVYLDNTNIEQMRELARMAGIEATIIDDTLILCPANGSRITTTVPVISASSGLIGYATADAAGVSFRAYLRPDVEFLKQFKLVSDQARTTGVWVATYIKYTLEAEKPGGRWEMFVRGNFLGTPYVGHA